MSGLFVFLLLLMLLMRSERALRIHCCLKWLLMIVDLNVRMETRSLFPFLLSQSYPKHLSLFCSSAEITPRTTD